MELDRYESIEQTAFFTVVQALEDYKQSAVTIFNEEMDYPQDIAEDVTREAIESMGAASIKERLYGKVDFKKGIYVFLPDAVPVALMVDAKAEKPNGHRTATIQMSQISMRVRMYRSKKVFDEPGKLEKYISRTSHNFYVVTVIVKYIYQPKKSGQKLERMMAACIPNGLLQERYNPSPDDTIWRAGRDAPTLGEDFRVRLHFADLQAKASWRVQEITW